MLPCFSVRSACDAERLCLLLGNQGPLASSCLKTIGVSAWFGKRSKQVAWGCIAIDIPPAASFEFFGLHRIA